MFKREERINDRYEQSRNDKLFDYISRQMQGRSTKNSHNRAASGNKTGNLNSSEIYSQPQIMRPRRGASILRNNSKSKYAQSMGKFRKDFIKDYANMDYSEAGVRRTSGKEEPVLSITSGLNFDQDIGVEELHYQMVKLHQNVKKMQKQT